MMGRIIATTERHKVYRSIITALEPEIDTTPSHAVATAAADFADTIRACAIVAFTSSGNTVARIARKRPQVPILAVTPDEHVSRRLCLCWGAHSVRSENVHSYEDMVALATQQATAEGFASSGNHIVVVSGIPFGQSGTTNNLRVVEVGK